MSSQKEKSFNEQGYLIWDHFIRNRPQFRNEGSKFSEGSTNMYGTTFHKIIGNYDPADFVLSPGASLGGVGIKNFDMKFEGTDFFTRDKSIVCGMSIYVDSMENIFKEPPTGYAPLAELFTISR